MIRFLLNPFALIAKVDYLVFTVFLITATSTMAQIHKPFDQNSMALYTTFPVAGETSSLAFTSAEEIGGDSVFHPLMTFRDDGYVEGIEIEEWCEDVYIWGNLCYQQNLPLWLGKQIRKINESSYTYETTDGDTLIFEFGIELGDTSLIYENEDEVLMLIAEESGTVDHLDFEDSVNQYRLAHLSAFGEPLNSNLHNAPITIGEELGAIHFMRIDSFPEIAQPIVLAGHSGAEVGLYEIKESEIYDYSVGDQFQYSYVSNESNPYQYVSHLETKTVTERLEDEDSIYYHFNVHRFKLDSTINTVYEEELSISKSAVFVSFPIESHGNLHPPIPNFTFTDYSYHYSKQRLVLTPDSCGSEYAYSVEATFLVNCPQGGVNCFANSLHLSPEDWYQVPTRMTFGQGLGKTYQYTGWALFDASPVGTSRTRQRFTLKDGLECGDQIFLSTEDQSPTDSKLNIYPNPFNSQTFIEVPNGAMNVRIEVLNSIGQIVRQLKPGSVDRIILDRNDISEGLYIVRMYEDNDLLATGKVLVID